MILRMAFRVTTIYSRPVLLCIRKIISNLGGCLITIIFGTCFIGFEL